MELSLLSDAFIACGFPVKDVDRIVQTYQICPDRKEDHNENNSDKDFKIFLPYIPRASDKLRSQLKKEKIDVVFLRGRTVGQWLCNNKPKNVPQRWKNKVYKVPCECGKFYIGESGQWWDDREKQHQLAVRAGDVKNSFAAHTKECGHQIKWEKVEFLDSHKYDRNRKIKEAIYINAFSSKDGPLLNLELGTKIDPIWNSLHTIIQKYSFLNSFCPDTAS